jgi:hypothetical protein
MAVLQQLRECFCGWYCTLRYDVSETVSYLVLLKAEILSVMAIYRQLRTIL